MKKYRRVLSRDTEEWSLKKNWLLVPRMTWGIWWILMRAVTSLVWKFAFWYMLLSWKIYYVWAKIVQRSCVITLKNDAKFEEELTCALKNHKRNLANFDQTLKSCKICTLIGSFWPKNMFELKKHRGVMRHYTDDRSKFWKKNDFWIHKWHEEFHQSTQKS